MQSGRYNVNSIIEFINCLETSQLEQAMKEYNDEFSKVVFDTAAVLELTRKVLNDRALVAIKHLNIQLTNDPLSLIGIMLNISLTHLEEFLGQHKTELAGVIFKTETLLRGIEKLSYRQCGVLIMKYCAINLEDINDSATFFDFISKVIMECTRTYEGVYAAAPKKKDKVDEDNQNFINIILGAIGPAIMRLMHYGELTHILYALNAKNLELKNAHGDCYHSVKLALARFMRHEITSLVRLAEVCKLLRAEDRPLFMSEQRSYWAEENQNKPQENVSLQPNPNQFFSASVPDSPPSDAVVASAPQLSDLEVAPQVGHNNNVVEPAINDDEAEKPRKRCMIM